MGSLTFDERIYSYKTNIKREYDKIKGYIPKGIFNILLVDDEPSVLESYDLVLKAFNSLIEYESFTAQDGVEAMHILEENKDIDLVITGINMPKMSGDELLIKIKEKYPHIEVAIVSAKSNPDIIVKCFENGAFDYLRKPFLVEALFNLICLGIKRRNKNEFIKVPENHKSRLDLLEIAKAALETNYEIRDLNEKLLGYTYQIKWLTILMVVFTALMLIQYLPKLYGIILTIIEFTRR